MPVKRTSSASAPRGSRVRVDAPGIDATLARLHPPRMSRVARTYSQISRFASATPEQWADWRWHVRHALDTPEALAEVIELTADERDGYAATRAAFRMAIPPYYAALMDPRQKGVTGSYSGMPNASSLTRVPFLAPIPQRSSHWSRRVYGGTAGTIPFRNEKPPLVRPGASWRFGR